MDIVKKFLSAEDLFIITQEMGKHNDMLTKEIIKDAIVGQLCVDEFVNKTNKEIEDLDCSEIYTLLAQNNMLHRFSTEIENYNIIDKIMYSEYATNNVLIGMVENFSQKLEEATQDFNPQQILSEIKSVVDDKGEK